MHMRPNSDRLSKIARRFRMVGCVDLPRADRKYRCTIKPEDRLVHITAIWLAPNDLRNDFVYFVSRFTREWLAAA